MARQFSLTNSTGDVWKFFASSERMGHRIIGGQQEMADGSIRKWIRTEKRRWTLGLDILERSDKYILIAFAKDVNNLLFMDDELHTAVSVQIDISTLDFDRLKSDEILYSTTITLIEV